MILKWETAEIGSFWNSYLFKKKTRKTQGQGKIIRIFKFFPGGQTGYEMIDSQQGVFLAVIFSHPTNTS